MITYLRCATVLLVLGAVASKAEPQSYPSKPITMVVPYSAGGPTDQSARLIGEHMSRTLGQPVVTKNVAPFTVVGGVPARLLGTVPQAE